MKKIGLIFIIFLSLAKSQDVQVDTLTNIESELFENFELDVQVDEIVDQFEFVVIELNKAGVDDLVAVPFITRETANKIIEYRDKIGGFKRREQVFDIPGVDEAIKSFLYRNGYIQKPKLSFQTRTRILNRDNIRYFANDFADNSKTYQLGRLAISNFSAGFVIEKDYGENRLNDLTHFFIEYRSSSFVRRFVLGSYVLKFGQGILMWSPVALGKGSDAITPVVRSSEEHLLGYASTDEVKPLFGGAFSSRFKNIELTLFYSKTNLPSSIDTIGRVKYIDFSGINTVQKFPLARKLFGGIVSFSLKNFLLGVLNFYEDFNRDFST
ncbi:MAG: helix-hairpin-helix domain-containing protein, partial [Candidatus Kryptonium sp.]